MRRDQAARFSARGASTVGKRVLHIELTPEPHLLFDRPPWSPPQETRFVEVPTAGLDAVLDDDLLGGLYTQFYIDHAQLEGQVSALLESRPLVTLGDVCAAFPPQKGVAEVLAYLELAANHPHHRIDTEAVEALDVPLFDGGSIRLRLPRIEFHRRGLP
ncbi:MAG: DUF3375 family protein [Blastochloris sp.]|nr:DUF3375 family protein [Blastochloris sp.]